MGKIDLTGQRFGRLVVVREIALRANNGSVQWECVCDCGNVVSPTGSNLRYGTTKSCGCYKKEKISELKTLKINRGEVFGELTIIKRIGSTDWKGNKSALYLCRCSCGSETEAGASNLRAGNTTSCGCKKRDTSQMMTDSAREKQKETINKTDLVENTKLSGISPKRKKSIGKTSEFIGVSRDSSNGYWISQLVLKGVSVHRKKHKNKQDAIDARKAAEEKYFKPVLEKYESEQKTDAQYLH